MSLNKLLVVTWQSDFRTSLEPHTKKKSEIFNCMFSLASSILYFKLKYFMSKLFVISILCIVSLLLQIDLAKVLFLILICLAYSIPKITGSKWNTWSVHTERDQWLLGWHVCRGGRWEVTACRWACGFFWGPWKCY